MSSAYAQEQEDHVTLENFGTHDVGELPNTVQLTYDDSAKTFNITGSGKLDKSKFGYITYQAGRSWSDSDGIYGKYIMPLIQEAPENYTISFSREVKLPNDSNSLFSLKGTRVEFPEQFDTSNVTNMRNMFSNAVAANPNVSNWNTSNVTDMGYMFSGASNANPEVSEWDTSSVTDMTNMFTNAVAANPNVSNWNTSNVTDMSNMFSGALNANPDTSKWNTGKVTDMVNMFKNARVANPNVSNWNTSNVTDMGYMFSGASNANPEVSEWDTSSVTDMGNMFYRAENADPDVSNWKTSNVTNMVRMFYQASNATPKVSNWDTGNVTNMEGMFAHAVKADPDVSKWDTSKVTVMRVMFTGATSANPDVSNWDTSNVVDMAGMFERASNAVPNVSKWDTRNVTDMNIMFRSATKADPDVSKWKFSKVTNLNGFLNASGISNIDVSSWDIDENLEPVDGQRYTKAPVFGNLDALSFEGIKFNKGVGYDKKYPLPDNLSFQNAQSKDIWFELVDTNGERLESDLGDPFKFSDISAKYERLTQGKIYSIQLDATGIAQAKAGAISAVNDLDALSEDQKKGFLTRVDEAGNVQEVEKVAADAVVANGVAKKAAADLAAAKSQAGEQVRGIQGLTEEQVSGFVAQVGQAQTAEEVTAVVTKAQQQAAENQKQVTDLAQAKAGAISAVNDLDALSEDQKKGFLTRVDEAGNVQEVEKVAADAVVANGVAKKAAADLAAAKSQAGEQVRGIQGLTEEQVSGFVAQVGQAQTAEEVTAVVTKAQQQAAENQKQSNNFPSDNNQTMSSSAPGVSSIAPGSHVITGEGTPGAKVKVVLPGGTTTTTTVDSNGSWLAVVWDDVLVKGAKVTVTQKEEGKSESSLVTVTVGKPDDSGNSVGSVAAGSSSGHLMCALFVAGAAGIPFTLLNPDIQTHISNATGHFQHQLSQLFVQLGLGNHPVPRFFEQINGELARVQQQLGVGSEQAKRFGGGLGSAAAALLFGSAAYHHCTNTGSGETLTTNPSVPGTPGSATSSVSTPSGSSPLSSRSKHAAYLGHDFFGWLKGITG